MRSGLVCAVLLGVIVSGCGVVVSRSGDRPELPAFGRRREPIDAISFSFELVSRTETFTAGQANQSLFSYPSEPWVLAHEAVEIAFRQSYQFVNVYPALVPHTWRAKVRVVEADRMAPADFAGFLSMGVIPIASDYIYTADVTFVDPSDTELETITAKETASRWIASVAYLLLLPVNTEATRNAVVRDLTARALAQAMQREWWPSHGETTESDGSASAAEAEGEPDAPGPADDEL